MAEEQEKEKDKEKSGGSKAADALSALLGRVAGFFDILDLSFFVSGATTLAALVYMAGKEREALSLASPSAAQIVGIVVACYALGLVVFAFGRFLRPIVAWITRLGRKELPQHRQDKWYSPTMRAAILPGRDYERLWVEMRQDARLAPSMSLLLRYWVMAATYDGVAAAACVWIGAIARRYFVAPVGTVPWSEPLATAILLVLVMVACVREAGRYGRYQAVELNATIGWVDAERARGRWDKP